MVIGPQRSTGRTHPGSFLATPPETGGGRECGVWRRYGRAGRHRTTGFDLARIRCGYIPAILYPV